MHHPHRVRYCLGTLNGEMSTNSPVDGFRSAMSRLPIFRRTAAVGFSSASPHARDQRGPVNGPGVLSRARALCAGENRPVCVSIDGDVSHARAVSPEDGRSINVGSDDLRAAQMAIAGLVGVESEGA